MWIIWSWCVTWPTGVMCSSNCMPYMLYAPMSHYSFRSLVIMDLRIRLMDMLGKIILASTSEPLNTRLVFSFMFKSLSYLYVKHLFLYYLRYFYSVSMCIPILHCFFMMDIFSERMAIGSMTSLWDCTWSKT